MTVDPDALTLPQTVAIAYLLLFIAFSSSRTWTSVSPRKMRKMSEKAYCLKNVDFSCHIAQRNLTLSLVTSPRVSNPNFRKRIAYLNST